MDLEILLWSHVGVLLSVLRWYLTTQNRAYLFGLMAFLAFEGVVTGIVLARGASNIPPPLPLSRFQRWVSNAALVVAGFTIFDAAVYSYMWQGERASSLQLHGLGRVSEGLRQASRIADKHIALAFGSLSVAFYARRELERDNGIWIIGGGLLITIVFYMAYLYIR